MFPDKCNHLIPPKAAKYLYSIVVSIIFCQSSSRPWVRYLLYSAIGQTLSTVVTCEELKCHQHIILD